MLFHAIRSGLGGLLRFSGRERRSTFWIFVAFVLILRVVISVVVAIPVTFGIVQTALQAGGAPGGDAVDAVVRTKVAQIAPTIVWASVWIAIGTVALLCAAFVRRLHDSGLSGWFALIPAAAFLGAQGQLVARLPQIEAALGVAARSASAPGAQAVIAPGWLGWVALIVLVTLGLRRSDPGRNRHGPGRSTL